MTLWDVMYLSVKVELQASVQTAPLSLAALQLINLSR